MNDPTDSSAARARLDSNIADDATDQPPTGLGDEQFRQTLDHLLAQVESLPPAERDRLRTAADATRRRHDQLKQTVARLQETLDHLRMSVKYLVFDVEATRRENAYLRKMIEESQGED